MKHKVHKVEDGTRRSLSCAQDSSGLSDQRLIWCAMPSEKGSGSKWKCKTRRLWVENALLMFFLFIFLLATNEKRWNPEWSVLKMPPGGFLTSCRCLFSRFTQATFSPAWSRYFAAHPHSRIPFHSSPSKMWQIFRGNDEQLCNHPIIPVWVGWVRLIWARKQPLFVTGFSKMPSRADSVICFHDDFTKANLWF